MNIHTQAIGSILRQGGGTYADYLSYKEVDCYDYRAEDFPKGKAHKKVNRHSCKVTIDFVALPQMITMS